jgi:hypothetical protein
MNSHGTWLRELHSYRIGGISAAQARGCMHNKSSFLMTIFPLRVVVPSGGAHSSSSRCTQWVIDIGFDPVWWTG